jgi:hypothetical protein
LERGLDVRPAAAKSWRNVAMVARPIRVRSRRRTRGRSAHRT